MPEALARAVREVEPAEVRAVHGEPLTLPPVAPDRWIAGVAPHGIRTGFRGQDRIPAPGALDAGSLVVRCGTRVLRRGADYLVDPVWGTIGTTAADAEQVTVDYRYSLRRLDAIMRREDGRVVPLRGRSHLTGPRPPVPASGELLGTVLVPYFGGAGSGEAFPYVEPPRRVSPPQGGRLPETTRRLREHAGLRVVCWGDSVTCGGDASAEATAYPALVERGLRDAGADARVTVVAVDGSNSAQWLSGEGVACDWRRVEAARPHLVTLEFVNDAELDPAVWPSLYGEILARVRRMGAELLVTTPHFTMPAWMGSDRPADPDGRAYTAFLRAFCRSGSVALADVSLRWEHLALEALPYVTLLHNGVNHPDDRGHALAADEILAALGATAA
ncbi:MAG TPA: GDSL-type esterase/lipase family protein [Streptosporangiales bacterium]